MAEVRTRSRAGSSRDKMKTQDHPDGLKNNWKEPPVDMKERNTWRRRREILGGEGEKYLEEKEVKIHSQQEKGGNFKTSEGTQFGVQRHISMNILVIYFAICCCTYIAMYIDIY